jgi:hypothetical protein
MARHSTATRVGSLQNTANKYSLTATFHASPIVLPTDPGSAGHGDEDRQVVGVLKL